ncbi:MAG: RNA polymerase subunit sigma [Planctomyces sp.]|nr:RNA polymerase subunit sigma [Planctomyces sp.]
MSEAASEEPPLDLATPSSPDDGTTAAASQAEFIQLFTKSQRRLYLYILTQVPHPVEAEEVLQEANVIVWSKAAQFQAGTNFFAWACQIAHYEILKYRSRQKRTKLRFSDEFIEQVAVEAVEQADELESRRMALKQCLGKLRDKDRELIESRYAPGERGKDLADQIGRPANSVYQSLGRIRRTLLECIQRQLAVELRS